MSEINRKPEHPKAFEPSVLIANIALAVLGSVIGMQIITTLGVTPNTALIGVLVAIALSRLPGEFFQKYRSVHRQNLLQSNISCSTFAAANSLMLPIGIPFLFGMPDLIMPMLIGATMGMLIDTAMLYWFFDSRVFPGEDAWPPGVAAAEAIQAGDEGGTRARLLIYGSVIGIIGSFFKIPMSALGTAFIGNIWALTMLGIGFLLRGYSTVLFGIDMNKLYIPHGMMIGAGVVAGLQIAALLFKRKKQQEQGKETTSTAEHVYTRSDDDVRKGLGKGFFLYAAAATILALIGGIYTAMPAAQLVGWIVFAAISCILAEFIVGLSAMHAGWFPAFATSLIFLVIGIMLGFPPVALALLVGFVASGGPAFADAGYDLKAGWLLRRGDAEYELAGRKQQILAAVTGSIVALIMVAVLAQVYFSQNLVPPVDRVFVATIKAGVDPSIVHNLLLWAVPGALIQFVGGSKRQMGIMLSTGLLILNINAGYAVLAGILIRVVLRKIKGPQIDTPMTIMAAGFIAGDAIYSFVDSAFRAKWK